MANGSDYPTSIDNFGSVVDDQDYVEALHINQLNDAVYKIEKELETNPKGSYSSVKTALEDMVAKTGNQTIAGVKTFSSFPVTPSSSPTTDYQVANKYYVDMAIQGLDWQESVIDKDLTAPPASPTAGDRYIVATGATGAWSGHDNEITQYTGSTWAFTTPDEGTACWAHDEDTQYVFNGTAWVKLGSTQTHNNLGGLQGGTTNEYYHLTNAQTTNLHAPATAGTGINITGQEISNTDRGSTAVTTHESTYNHTNYNTAYGWGNHASAGYFVKASDDLDDISGGTTNKHFTATNQTKLNGIETAADVTDAGNVGAAINGATEKTTPVDSDKVGLLDSAASFALKWLSWTNIKATLKTYFDTIYAAIGHNHTGTYAPAAQGVTNGDSHDHNGGDGAQIDHVNLANKGTNTHATIDTFIASKAQNSGLASLDANGKLAQSPANSSITYAMIQNVSATDKLLGRSSAGAGVTEEIACTAAGRALLDDANNTAQRTTLGLGDSATKNVGTTTGTVCAGDDSRLSNARTPTTHATSHVTGGSDVIANAVAGGNAGLMSGTDKTKLNGIESAADVTDAGNVGAAINGATEKTTPVDADKVGLLDSAASFALKWLSWTNIKATLKTYFDTIYAAIGHNHTGTYAPAAQGVTNGNSHDHNGGDGAQIDHVNLANKGTNTHATIDTFIASKAQNSGLASLDANGKLAQSPANSSITYAMIQNVSATDKILGRSSAGAGVTEEIACTAAGRALLDDANNTAQRTTLGLGDSATKNVGTTTGTVCAGDDSRLSNARTPTTHATSHITNGSDVIANAVAGVSSGLMSGADKAKLDGIDTTYLKLDGSNDPITSSLEISDTDASPQLIITNASDDSHDPSIAFRVGATPTTKFTMGVDDGDGDKFKISNGSALGTDDRLTIDSSGNITIPGNVAPANDNTKTLGNSTYGYNAVYASQIVTPEGRNIWLSPGGTNNIKTKNTVPQSNDTYSLGGWGEGYSYAYYFLKGDPSSRSLKKNIEKCDLGLEFINKLKPVKFQYKEEDEKETKKKNGFIAEDIIEALGGDISGTKLVNYHEGRLIDDGTENGRWVEPGYSIDPDQIIPTLVNAIQELSEEIDRLKKKIV